MPEFSTVWQAIQTGGSTGVLIVFLLAMVRGWLVSGRELEEMRADRDDWKRQALNNVDTSRRSIDVAEALLEEVRDASRRSRR